MGTELNAQLEFYINGVAILIVAVLGLLGNSISICQFTARRMNMNPTFTSLLVWLAVIDSLFLCAVVLVFSLPELVPTYKVWVFPLLLPCLLPLTSILLTASVYTLVALALERYLHITRPQWSNKGAFFGYILPVLVFSTCYNFPKFFEFTTKHLTRGQDRVPVARATEFRNNADYSLYWLGVNCLVMGLLPFSILISLNVAISRQLGTEMRERSMRGLLASLMLVQLACHAPRIGLNIFEMWRALRGERVELEETWLVDLSHLLLATCAACNVVIYVVQDVRFRSLLAADLSRCLLLQRSQSVRPVTEPLMSTTCLEAADPASSACTLPCAALPCLNTSRV